jgi:hypothetical protein
MNDFFLEPLDHRSLQGDGAAGGVFLGGNQTSTGEGSLGDGLGLTIVLVILAMVGGVALIAGITWFISYVSDYYCCCLPWFRPVNTHVRFDHGRVAKQARLFGLTLAERQKLLDHLFGGDKHKENKLVYQPGAAGQAKTDASPKDAAVGPTTLPLAAPTEVVPEKDEEPPKDAVMTETDVEAAADSDPDSNDDNKNDDKNDDNNDDEGTPPMDDADHERLCCICLAEYQKGDHLLRGQTCGHQFHYTCSMDWLSGHDHCPYCRQELFTPAQYRQAAVRLLGDKRVAEMDLFVPRTTTPVVVVVPAAESAAGDQREGDVELPSMPEPTAEAPGAEEAPVPSTQETPDEGTVVANEDDSTVSAANEDTAEEVAHTESGRMGQSLPETPAETPVETPPGENEGEEESAK